MQTEYDFSTTQTPPSVSYIIKPTIAIVHDRAYNSDIDFEWDPAKARENRRKHGIRFSDTVFVFADDRAITIEDDFAWEQRYVTIGSDLLGRVLVVVFTSREESIRIISARKATARERRQYRERS